MSSKKENLEVIISIGVSASGKSTWSKEFVKRNANYVRTGRDDFRYMLKDAGVCEPKIEDIINKLQDATILEALNKNQNVIIDNTNLKEEYIKHFIDLVKYKANIKFRIFDISLNKAIERDKLRERSVGEVVIKKQFKQYQNLITSVAFTDIQKSYFTYVNPKRDVTLTDIVIFDIDGTLAHMNGKRGPFDWHKVGVDDLDSTIANQLLMHNYHGDKIFIVSGRDESCRSETIAWLEKHGLPFHNLFMRPKDDFRKDNLIKQEIYEREFKDKYNIKLIYDDRDQVVKMWRSLGLKCVQVEEGNF